MTNNFNNISPLDNRYSSKIENVRANFSEFALIKIRFEIEIDWIIYLCTNKPNLFKKISDASIKKLEKFKNNFNDDYVTKIKEIESITNHDVKAVEYFIRDSFIKDSVLKNYIQFIHFGLTSEDINSLSYAVMIKKGINIYLADIEDLNSNLNTKAHEWSDISFLSRTHGQPASPSTIGKEIAVFNTRLIKQIATLKSIKPLAKFSGATGNYHTFFILDPKINWQTFTNKFIKSFGVTQNSHTTQIEPHDWIAETSHSIIRINNILIDLSQDMWIYISNEIFKLKLLKNEVGSSTMPHKVNPIDFENGEGNLGISNSLLEFFANKLTKSRHQRDLSDSTVLRNVGLGFGYSILSIKSIFKGMNKIDPNLDFIQIELNDNWEVLAEAVQTIMRFEGIPDAYEQLKDLSRGSKLDSLSYKEFVNNLDISTKSKKSLIKLTPSSYIGLANRLSKSSK
ncbi:MAG: adenylosuccinate lyase [Gammaproteobacteria bacterium]|nr:adenylosuccinate lyase [Gammaproteobacteria bacterium]